MINRSLWISSFEKDKFPAWICSRCNIGVYELMSEHFFYTDDADTIADRDKPDFYNEFVRYRFSAVLKCNNRNCKETAIITGRGGIDEYSWEDDTGSFSEEVESFYPEYCCPPPLIFQIPENTPEKIKNLILSSFCIFFSDPQSVANKLRRCLEEILKIAQIPQTNACYKLESRLKKLCGQYSIDNPDFLDVIKFIGDEGSHGGDASSLELNKDNILDAYEIIESILNDIYMKKEHNNKLNKISSKYQILKK